MNVHFSEILDEYGVNLNAEAISGNFDPVLCREIEIRSILEVLCRKNKNNPILVGKPGVGKTSIVEGIASLLLNNSLPKALQNKTIYSIQISDLIAGTAYRGEFEERLNLILKEVKRSGNIILFLDEIHNVIGTGAVRGSLDIANILKPLILKGDIRIIGATTDIEFEKYISSDKAFERRFQRIEINEPDTPTAIQMLIGSKERYERHHNVKINPSAIKTAVELSTSLISDRFLPDKALDIIDMACSSLRLDLDTTPLPLLKMECEISKIQLHLSTGIAQNEKNHSLEQHEKLDSLIRNKDLLINKLEEEKATFLKKKRLVRVINSYKKEAESNEKIGYKSKFDEITDSLIPPIEMQLRKVEQSLELSRPIVYKEEIDSYDIKCTIQRMLNSAI